MTADMISSPFKKVKATKVSAKGASAKHPENVVVYRAPSEMFCHGPAPKPGEPVLNQEIWGEEPDPPPEGGEGGGEPLPEAAQAKTGPVRAAVAAVRGKK